MRHATWLGSFTPAEQEALLARPAADPLRGAAARVRERPDERPPRAADLRLREDLPPGRHPGEGRPGEHGVLARGAGAVPGRRARRVPRPRSRAAQAPSPRHQAPAQARDGGHPAAGHRRPAEEGLRHSGRGLAQGRAPRGARRTSSRPSGSSGRGSSSPTSRCAGSSRAHGGRSEIIESRSGRCSSSSSGTGAGSKHRRLVGNGRAQQRGARMKRALLEDLVCPVSLDPLVLEGDEAADDVETRRARLHRLRSPLADPRRASRASSRRTSWSSSERRLRPSGGSGSTSSEMHHEFEAQFLDWVHPLEPEFFQGKRVLDAGCGIGRHAYYAASYGSDEVVAVDLSGAVETARRNLESFDNVHVVQGDLLRLAVSHALRTAAASTSSTRSASCTTCPIRTRGSGRSSSTSGPGARSPSGSTATRTTGSSGTSSSRFGGCPRGSRRPCSAGSPGRWRSGSTAWRKASTARSTERPSGSRLPLDELPDERGRLQLPPELRDRLRPARRADRRVHHRAPSSRAGSERAGSRTSGSRIDTETRGAAKDVLLLAPVKRRHGSVEGSRQ